MEMNTPQYFGPNEHIVNELCEKNLMFFFIKYLL